jgi:hypothetical protein
LPIGLPEPATAKPPRTAVGLDILRDGHHMAVKPPPKEEGMLLALGIILLIIAIAGGAIIHPILFALAIVAIALFFAGRRGHAY